MPKRVYAYCCAKTEEGKLYYGFSRRVDSKDMAQVVIDMVNSAREVLGLKSKIRFHYK